MERWKKGLFFLVASIGVFALFAVKNMQPDIPLKPALNKAKWVEITELKKESIAPIVTVFGLVEAKKNWQAVAEISGKMQHLSPLLEEGQIVTKGTEVARFELKDIELNLQKAASELEIKKAKIETLEQEEKNLKAVLVIERDGLAISEKEYKRQKNLKNKGLNSQSSLEKEQKNWLLQKSKVQELENRLALMPAEKRILLIEKETALISLAQIERELEKARIKLPFDARIGKVEVVENEYVSAKQLLFSANGLSGFEVEASISLHDYYRLFVNDFTQKQTDPLIDFADIKAKVKLENAGDITWPAYITRVSDTFSAKNASLSLFLAIELSQADKKARFPILFSGMFMAVELEGVPRMQWVVPERALRGNKLYLFDEGVLRIKPVKVLYRVAEKVVIQGQFKTGQKVVLNDLIPAVDGMALSVLPLKEGSSKAVILDKKNQQEMRNAEPMALSKGYDL